MKKLLKNLGILIVILLVVAAIFAQIQSSGSEVEQISFSKFAQEVKSGEVKSANIDGNEVSITLDDGTKQYTIKEPQSSLAETLTSYGISSETLNSIEIDVAEPSNTSMWINIAVGVLPILILIGFFWFMMKQAKNQSMGALNFGKSNAELARFKDEDKAVFDDVANLKEAKEQLEEVVDFLKHPKKYIDMGAEIPKGTLLTGAPGTGKTLLARAVAGEADVPFFHISGSEFVEMFVGVGASRVRDLFKNAKKNSPSIIFIDEIDAVARKRGTGIGGGHDEREQTLNQILTEMDGFDERTNVIVIAATNRPDVLDPALLRPGRFDRKIILDKPDIKARKEILEIHAEETPLSDEVDLREVAERTPGMSGADLENVINEAAILAAKENRDKIKQEDLTKSVEKVMLGAEKKSKVFTEKEKKITAYHEAGHALIAEHSENTDPVRKVSIVSRGQAGGYTLQLPEEDKHLHSFPEFKQKLSVLFGGYTAEKITFDEVTTGASNDLQKATKIARNLVTKYGMSEMGPIAFEEQDQAFLGEDLTEKRNYSEETAAEIDGQIKNIMNSAYKRAQRIIKKNKDKLEDLAQTLIEKETVEREELLKILELDEKLEEKEEDNDKTDEEDGS